MYGSHRKGRHPFDLGMPARSSLHRLEFSGPWLQRRVHHAFRFP